MNKDLIRQCISCRKQFPRRSLIRITKTREKVVLNPSKYELGRSAYVCRSTSCINLALKEKKIAKMLRTSLNSLEDIIPELEVAV